jgi:hypothetical protein
MLAWFAGEFDNNRQVFVEREQKLPAAEVHQHIHSIFTKVDLPAFGPHVFYVQQYLDGDPAKIYRQRCAGGDVESRPLLRVPGPAAARSGADSAVEAGRCGAEVQPRTGRVGSR